MTYVCDYNHYDADAGIRLEPAQVWVQDAWGEWTPLCLNDLVEFHVGGDNEDGPWTVYPIHNVPTGTLRIVRMDDR